MKTTLKPNKRFSLRAGFSLVELLVVIAVIGVIAAIAIPNIAGITGGANAAKDQRNAQQIVSTFAAALAANAAAAAVATDETTAVAAVTGAAPDTAGTLSFHVPNLGADIGPARDYIQWNNGTLEYIAAGDGTDDDA